MTEILIIVAFVAGWIWGHFKAVNSMVERTHEHPEELMNILQKIKENQKALEVTGDAEACEIKIEQIQDQYYIFRTDTDEFIAQGASFDLAVAAAQERFPRLTYFYEHAEAAE